MRMIYPCGLYENDPHLWIVWKELLKILKRLLIVAAVEGWKFKWLKH